MLLAWTACRCLLLTWTCAIMSLQVAIDHVAAFDWPRERLIVQICDDSEDQVQLYILIANGHAWTLQCGSPPRATARYQPT